MVSISMTVGPKGQVVIPKVFRNEYGLRPGSKVVFEDKADQLTLSKEFDAEAFSAFLKAFAAKHGVKNFKYDANAAYDNEMEERFKNSSIRRILNVR